MSVKEFSSLDELVEYIESCNQRASNRVEPWQSTVKPGDCFVRFTEGFAIYGKVLDPVQSEVDAGADEEEVEYQRELRDAPHMKHYRFARCFSELCPEGELGDVHVSTIATIITESMFENAKTLGWPSSPELISQIITVNSSGGQA